MAAPNPLLQKYIDLRNSLAVRIPDPVIRARSLQNFDADPRVQKLRQAAGLAPLSTRQGGVQQAAKQSLQQRVTDAGTDIGKNAHAFQSGAAGIARGLFGVPELLAAAGERFLPSAITGNNTDASFSNILQMIRAKDTAAINANPGAGLAGEIGGSIVGGGAAGRAVAGLAGRVAATGAPVASTIAKAVQAVGTLNKGQKAINAGKLAAIGAAAGGAQAAGTGEDVPTGAAEGAVAAPLAAGGIKALALASRPLRDITQVTGVGKFVSQKATDVLANVVGPDIAQKLGLNVTGNTVTQAGAGQILNRLTTATPEQLAARYQRYKAATKGAEPTLFELLPQVDRNKLLSQGVVNNQTAEQASNAIRARAANLGPEMADVTAQALQPGRDGIRAGITQDLVDARGGRLAEGDDELIDKAMKSPTDMEALRKVEAKAIMAPHANTPVVNNLVDLLPTMPGPNGTKIDLDPEVSNTIRGAAGSIRLRAPGEPITADEITNMMTTLGGEARKGGIQGQTAQTAIDHLQSVLHANAPEAGAAAQQMSDAFAARSRMLEGMKFGQGGQLRDSVQIGTSGNQARVVRNAFDSPEGQAGLTLGQGNALDTNLGGSPDEALRATIAQSRGSTGRQLAQNLGAPAADTITAAAQAQDQSAQALASAAKTANSPDDAGSGEGLVQALVGLHPGSFATTKAWSMRRLMDMTYIPANRAKTMVDMLFSQNPAMTQKAIQAIGNEPNGAGFLKALAGTTGQLTADTAAQPSTAPTAPAPVDDPYAQIGTAAPVTADEDPYAPITAAAPASASEDPYVSIGTTAPGQPADSPYAGKLAATYQNENPELVALVQRAKQQESGGDQSKVSKKGAVGALQVMPKTAPEAAALAGVPWDEKAYHNDGTYNEILGHAYMANLLKKYGGNVSQALAAYNAGEGKVDNALATHGDNFLSALPAETQDYVAKVGGQDAG